MRYMKTTVIGVRLNDYQIEKLTEMAHDRGLIPEYIRNLIDKDIDLYVKRKYERTGEHQTG